MRKTNGGRVHGEGIHDVNMTPLIDVCLVLVVILMVATPMAFQSSLAVHTASQSGRAAQERARTDRIELDIHADGTVGVNKQLVPRQALAAVLRPLLEQSATRLVIVRCDDNVSHGGFVGVLDDARAQGASQIAVVGR